MGAEGADFSQNLRFSLRIPLGIPKEIGAEGAVLAKIWRFPLSIPEGIPKESGAEGADLSKNPKGFLKVSLRNP